MDTSSSRHAGDRRRGRGLVVRFGWRREQEGGRQVPPDGCGHGGRRRGGDAVLAALTELCEALSFCTEDAGGYFLTEDAAKALVSSAYKPLRGYNGRKRDRACRRA